MTGRLSPQQRMALRKLGDVLIPGDGALPSFSQSGCDEHIDRMLPYLNDGDRKGLLALLDVLRFCPRLVIVAILAASERHRVLPGPLGALARTVNLGLKGVVMTLYYSDVGRGPSIRELIGWDAKVVEHADGGEAETPATDGATEDRCRSAQ